jgi:SpoVK/Ycf46/Vps4 family AAA+-type ATPase
LVEPAGDGARRGDLADLVATEHPDVRLSDMTLAPTARARLERVLQEQRQRDLLALHGFAPLRRLLLTGPAGTGKSMTAAALAAELSLPLVTVHLDALTSKYAGEMAVKLRVVYDTMAHGRTVYRFDGLDAIEARPEDWYDIGKARRILDMFISFLNETQPESLIAAVAGHSSLLDDALLRRFDAVIPCGLPDPAQAVDLLRRHLAALDTSAVSWEEAGNHVSGISQSDLIRAAESAAKRAILHDGDSVSTAVLVAALSELRGTGQGTGFSRSP